MRSERGEDCALRWVGRHECSAAARQRVAQAVNGRRQPQARPVFFETDGEAQANHPAPQVPPIGQSSVKWRTVAAYRCAITRSTITTTRQKTSKEKVANRIQSASNSTGSFFVSK
jgi:hypothetical protein